MELLINVFGRDRPGLVADLTEIFYDHGANLGDVNMTRLGGSFALILQVTVDADEQNTIEDELWDYADSRDVEITVVPAGGFHGDWGDESANAIVTVYGADQPGIVFRVTRVLGEEQINICNLDSSRNDEDELYILVLEVARPQGMKLGALRESLDPLANELDVTIQVEDLSSAPL